MHQQVTVRPNYKVPKFIRNYMFPSFCYVGYETSNTKRRPYWVRPLTLYAPEKTLHTAKTGVFAYAAKIK